ncbi:hypothetical protein LINGRAHAP2_LOCUS21602 [Linum grandiflorum]
MQTSSPPQLPLLLPKYSKTSIHGSTLNRAICPAVRGRGRRPSWTVNAENNSKPPQQEQQPYEIDPEQAKQALQRLDQQLQQLSTKQINTPKLTASDVEITREQMRQELKEIPGSTLAYGVAALFAFTIFYNILFLTVIKPSIDGPDPIPGATIRVQMEPYAARILQLLPPFQDGFL